MIYALEAQEEASKHAARDASESRKTSRTTDSSAALKERESREPERREVDAEHERLVVDQLHQHRASCYSSFNETRQERRKKDNTAFLAVQSATVEKLWLRWKY